MTSAQFPIYRFEPSMSWGGWVLIFLMISNTATADVACDPLLSLTPLIYSHTSTDVSGVTRLRASPHIEHHLTQLEQFSTIDQVLEYCSSLSFKELLSVTTWILPFQFRLHRLPMGQDRLVPLARFVDSKLTPEHRVQLVRALIHDPISSQTFQDGVILRLEPKLLLPLLNLAVLGTTASNLEHTYLAKEREQRTGSDYPWVHGAYQSSAVSLRALHQLINRLEIKRFVDIGSGFGTTILPLALLHPDIEFIGYEYQPDKIKVSVDRAERLAISNAHFKTQDAGETSFFLPDADFYYFYDPLSEKAAQHIVHDLKIKAAEGKKFTVVIQRGLEEQTQLIQSFLQKAPLSVSVQPFGDLESLKIMVWQTPGMASTPPRY